MATSEQTGYTLNQGDSVEYRENHRDREDGFLTGVITWIRPDGGQARITPDHPAVRDVYPDGVTVGSAHWGTVIVRRADEEG
jgi:hypothetical protein